MIAIKTLQRLFQHLSPYAFWALTAIVTSLLLMEQTTTTITFPHVDKIVHAIMFATMTMVGYFAYINHRIWLYVGLAIYGGMTELMQGALTITRQASLMDWVADITGILLCALICNIYNARFKAT